MILLINYANKKFRSKQLLNSLSARLIGRVDKVINYDSSSVEKDFIVRHKDIFSKNRGDGLWLWKPYLIKKAYEQNITEGDYLIYCDSGILITRPLTQLIDSMKKNNDNCFISLNPTLERQYTHPFVLDYFNYENYNYQENQAQAGFLIFRKSRLSEKLIDDWLNSCSKSELLAPSIHKQDNFFIAHREDQSLLSVSAKKLGIPFYSDPSDYQFYPNRYKNIDLKNQIIKLPLVDTARKLNKTYFLIARKENMFLYLFKFSIKRVRGAFSKLF